MIGGVQQTTMDGRYRLLDLLGRGGMGEVYLARDEVLDREVAVKVLAERYSRDEEAVERFRREARSAAALSHPHIVPVHDLGETAGGAHYIVMEYVPGGTLKERILRGGPMDARTAAGISSQVAAALGAAHEGGVIHRDVKPENILFAGSGEAKVTDFGIARAASSPRLTEAGFALGTADYMSPEQALGEAVGPASDLYSLGVVLYQMLTGERPFEADSPLATAVKHANEPPPRLRRPEEGDPAFPGGMDAVVSKLLAKDPGERYESAPGLVADLERATDGLSRAESEPAKPRGASPLGASRGTEGPSGGPPVPGADTVLGAAARKKRAKGRRRRFLGGAVLSAAAILLLLGVAGAFGPSRAWDGGFLRDLPRYPSPGDGAQEGGPQGTGEDEGDPARAATVKEKVENSDDVSPSSGAADRPGSAFVHRATPGNVSDNSTYVDDPRTNGRPGAVVSVTQNWNPGGKGGTYNDHQVGVWYDASAGKWAIFNQDRAAMPEGAAFNVTVSDGGPSAD